MSEIRIKTANPDVITNIPETLGNIKVKDENGIIRDVKKLYAKNGSGEPSLVWDATVAPPSTQDSTQPILQCPSCESGSEVFYPEIQAIGKRWDYCTWKDTGLLSSCWKNPPETRTYASIRKQDPDKLNFLPPPPNYIMGELLSYTVPDRVLVFVNRPLVSDVPNHTDKIFYGKQDNSFPCLEECSPSSGCQLNEPDTTLCDVGSSTQSIYGIIDQRHLLIDTSCVSTGSFNNKTNSCSTYCYGEPDFTTVCRSVNRIHPLYLEDLILTDFSGACENQYPEFSLIQFNFGDPPLDPPYLQFANDYTNNNLFLTIKDISVIVDSSCSNEEFSAWTFRMFLPIYVYIPTERNNYVRVQTPLDSIMDGLLAGNNSNINLITETNPNYDPIVHAVYRVLSGETKLSQAFYSSNANNDARWGIIGYPRAEPVDFPLPDKNLATHCVVIEVTNAEDGNPTNNCNYCSNTREGSSFKASNIRFYPLESYSQAGAPGSFAAPLQSYGNQNDLGYDSLDQINEVYSDCAGIVFFGKTYSNTAELSFQDFYNAYYQPYITTTESTDCNTTCL